jgi:nucleotide-binding universal stress UspA family protein
MNSTPETTPQATTTTTPDRDQDRTARPRVVVGVDGSTQSKAALRWAAQIAEGVGARLVAVTAWDWPYTYGIAAMPIVWNPAEDMARVLSNAVKEALGAGRAADVEELTLEGGAARVLLDTSEGAVMLVVGSRGHGGFAGLLLGSVSANVAEHATCPVLVVHGEAAVPAVTA